MLTHILASSLSDECSVGGPEPDVEREDGEAGGGHDGVCAVSRCTAGSYTTAIEGLELNWPLFTQRKMGSSPVFLFTFECFKA